MVFAPWTWVAASTGLPFDEFIPRSIRCILDWRWLFDSCRTNGATASHAGVLADAYGKFPVDVGCDLSVHHLQPRLDIELTAQEIRDFERHWE